MKLNIRAFAIAMTIAAAILYIVCAAIVALLPDLAMGLAGKILHMDLSGLMRPISVGGFLVGLLALSVGWGLLSLIMASIYNSLVRTGD